MQPAPNRNINSSSPAEQKVLIVEDNDLSRLYYASILENLKVSFVLCNTFASAVTEAMSLKYDLILSDAKLEDGNGIDLLRLFSDANVKGTPFVVASGYTESELYEQYGRFTASAIVTKPVGAQNLSALLCELLNIRRESTPYLSDHTKSGTTYDHSLLFEVHHNNKEQITKSCAEFMAYITDALERIELSLVDGDFERLRSSFHHFINLAHYFGANQLYQMIKRYSKTAVGFEKKELLGDIKTELGDILSYYSNQDFAKIGI